MLFGIVILIIIGVIAYWHYLQGLFSSGLSAVLAMVAAVMAVGWHETVIDLVLGGKFADYAHAAVLVSLFVTIYLVLRVVFDALVPGNLRFPFLVEKIGAAAFGVVAGLFTAGIIAVAAQMMPLDPTLWGYERYAMEYGKKINLKVLGPSAQPHPQNYEAIYDELKNEPAFRENKAASLLIPADDILLGVVAMASDDNGALGAGRPFAAAHPDYLQELFGQRLLQTGARHVALGGRTSLVGTFTAPSLPQDDQERFEVNKVGIGTRSHERQPEAPPKLPPTCVPDKGRVLLIVRARLAAEDADELTTAITFSPGGARLVANRKNYFPIGTLDGGKVLFVNQIHDYLFAKGGKVVDFVFDVDENDLLMPGPDKPSPTALRQIKDGVFFEFKRLARLPLGGQTLGALKPIPEEEEGILRKQGPPRHAIKKAEEH